MKRFISVIICIVIAFISWYFMLPPLNVTSPLFWSYFFELILVCGIIFIFSETFDFHRKFSFKKFKWVPIVGCSALVTIGIILIINTICSPLFNASKYANRIVVDETGVFTEDVAQVDFNKIPL